MSAVYVIATIPAALRSAADSTIAPFLLSPPIESSSNFPAELVPLPGPVDVSPTAYGCCAPCGPETVAAVGALTAALPGSSAHTVDPAAYDYQTHWIDWLAAQGLKVRLAD